MGTEITPEQLHFAVFAIEAAAQKSGIPVKELYQRLQRLDLIRNRLFADYDTLHTQSRDYIADDLIETLQNWEAYAEKKGGQPC